MRSRIQKPEKSFEEAPQEWLEYYNKKSHEWRKREAYFRHAQDRADGKYKANRDGEFLEQRKPIAWPDEKGDPKLVPVDVAKALANRNKKVLFYLQLADRIRMEAALARARAEAYERQWAIALNAWKMTFSSNLRDTAGSQ